MKKDLMTKVYMKRWFITRGLCLIHLSASIYLLLATASARHLFYLPIIGLFLIVLETFVSSLLDFRFRSPPILLLVYSIFIISTIWVLQLHRIDHLNFQQTTIDFTLIKSTERFFLNYKYLWSEIQTQVYVFIIVILKGLCQTKTDRLNMIMKTWTTALDLLDFIELLYHPKLYSNIHFVYITLSIWSISCLQFIIQISTIQKMMKKNGYHRLGCCMTDPLLSVILMDIPYLMIRLYAIFGVRKHDYTSYFLVFKNLVVIILQAAHVWNIFVENVPKTKRRKRNQTSFKSFFSVKKNEITFANIKK